MNHNRTATGHLAAFVTILIWGTTSYPPKSCFGHSALWKSCSSGLSWDIWRCGWPAPVPCALHPPGRRDSMQRRGSAVLPCTISWKTSPLPILWHPTWGVIISIAPFFTAILGWMFLGGERPRFRFFAGFLLAMAGISLISFGNEAALSLNPTGDLLAVAAAVIWAVYSTLTKKISALGHGTVQSTRRTFFYGILFMVPALTFMDFYVTPAQFTDMKNILNLLFLGLGASALCFVTWNTGVKILGPVKTSVYIYMVPVITTLTSALILKEPVTIPAALGIIMTLAGLFLSEQKTTKKGEPKIWTTKMKNV